MRGRSSNRTELEARVLGAIDEDELVQLASALIDAGGENPGDTEEFVARVLIDTCRDLGFDIEIDYVAPGRPNVVVSVGGTDEPGVLFLGHSDVVPAGGGWSRDPFAATVRDGRLYGRGACDMKGGLAAVVVAMSALKRCGAVGSTPVSLACLVDEEDTGLGIRSFVRTAMRRSYSRCIVAEPTDLMTIVGCRGAANLEITVRGRSAHAGRPSNGRNAISVAARIIVVIDSMAEELRGNAHPVLGAATFNVGTVSGGTGTSMVADCAVITVDRRLLPGEDAHIVAAQLHRRILDSGIIGDGIEVAVDVSMEMPGFLTSEDSDIVQSAVAAVADSAGHHGTDIWTASCDGGFIVRDMGIPAIVLGAGEIEMQAHQPDESVSVRQLCDSAAAYALIACRSVALPGVMTTT